MAADPDIARRVNAGNSHGYNCVHKFGRNPVITPSTDPEDIWSPGALYTFLDDAQPLFLSSSDDSDTHTIVVEGLDKDWNQFSSSVVLTGQTQVELPGGPFRRAFRAYNDDSTVTAGDIYIAETGSLTAGVPDTFSKIKAKIDAAYQQTLMAIYTIPNGKIGFLYKHYATINGGAGAGERDADIVLYTREEDKVFRVREFFGLNSRGGGGWQYDYPFPVRLAPRTDIKMTVDVVLSTEADVSGGFDILLTNE